MRVLISICLVVVLISCKKQGSDCIESKVDEFKASPPCPHSSSVKEYIFQDKRVYLFLEGNCASDPGATVYDSNCNYLGYLGGFGGLRKIDGVEFYANAQYKRTIWHN